MCVISIPDLQIDSLANWKSVDDICNVYPFLTAHQAEIVNRFQTHDSVSIKSSMLHQLIYSMCREDASYVLSEDEMLLVIELLNSDLSIRDEIVESVNTISEFTGTDIHIEI